MMNYLRESIRKFRDDIGLAGKFLRSVLLDGKPHVMEENTAGWVKAQSRNGHQTLATTSRDISGNGYCPNLPDIMQKQLAELNIELGNQISSAKRLYRLRKNRKKRHFSANIYAPAVISQVVLQINSETDRTHAYCLLNMWIVHLYRRFSLRCLKAIRSNLLAWLMQQNQ